MIRSIKSVKVKGRRVLLRVGFDVPLQQESNGKFVVLDDARIKNVLPTIEYLIQAKAKIVIASHLGRPGGQWQPEKSLYPVAEKLAELLNRKIVRVKDKLPTYKVKHLNFLDSDITLSNLSQLSKDLEHGGILFLENLRFYSGEEENDTKFISTLATFGDVYVNDAFSVAHRKESSVYGVAQKLPSYAGFSLLNEIEGLNKAIKNPRQPLIVIMGGAKISDKIDTIHFLAPRAEKMLIGGAIANSFLQALGYEIGISKVAEVSLAKELIRQYRDKIILPLDVVVAKSPGGAGRATNPEKVLPFEAIYDIGPKTIKEFAKLIKQAQTLIWNGPLGLIEEKKFAIGSRAIAQVFASRTKGRAYGVVGGGETLEVIDQMKVGEFIDHVSAGGGAMLEYLSGKVLPGIKVLEK